jgi:hypothetical protein
VDDPDETVRLQVALRCRNACCAGCATTRTARCASAWPSASTRPSCRRWRDPDYQVRQIVAQRLPEALLPMLMHDTDLQVRLAWRSACPCPRCGAWPTMAAPEVRRVLAQRLPVPCWPLLATDSDWTVRWEVAGRAAGATLARLAADVEPEVRERAAAHGHQRR